jgi:hypothetical protein
MRTNLQLVGMALALTVMSGHADACSCALDSSAEEVQINHAFDDTRVIVVASLVSAKQTSVPDAPNYLTEDAEFVVSEVLKGDVVPGQKIRIRSHLGSGSCGRSAQNNPVWLEEIKAPGEPTKPASISKKWLIYGHGSEPYELSLCDRSSPLNVRGASDLKYLRTLPGHGK